MSINITPVGSASATPAPQPTAAAATAAPAQSGAAVTVDAIPSSPPTEVNDAIAVAAQSYDRLAAGNRTLQFRIDESTGKLQIEVHDLKGNLLFAVPPSKALEIAGGGSPD